MTKTDMQRIQKLVSEVGPLDDDIIAVVQTGDDSFAVRYEHVDVDVEVDAETGRLALSTEIATPAKDQRLAVYEALLSYSLLWRETGGVRMALAGPGGPAVQIVELSAAELTPQTLVTAASNLADRTLVWRSFFASNATTGEATFDALASPGIRV